jgi:hypothetical protein
MASKAGRKRKPGHREPNGRPQRPTQSVLNELNQREAMKVKAVVLAQPHRRNSKDPEARECEPFSALERFCKHLGGGDEIILAAGLRYKKIVRDWRSTKGISCDPSPEEKTGAGGGDGPAWQVVQGWLCQIHDLERAMMRASFTVLEATKQLVVENIDPETRQQKWDALLGLRIVAHELGMYGKDHPFR